MQSWKNIAILTIFIGIWATTWAFARALSLDLRWSFAYPCLYALLGMFALSMIGGMMFRRRGLARFVQFVSIVALIAVIFGYFADRYHWLERFSDVSSIKALLAHYGKTSALVYIGIQFLQVTIIPIPSAVTTLAGVALFGLWKTVAYSTIGVVSGSMFAFFLGRKAGVRLICWMCGESAYRRYRAFVDGKDTFVLTTMFLLPFFPDDLLCLVAGISDFTYRGFFWTMLWTRPIGILSVAGAWNGILAIPLRGWGIVIWIVLIGLVVLVMALIWKFGAHWQQAWSDFLSKRRRRQNKSPQKDLQYINENQAIHACALAQEKTKTQQNRASFSP